MRIGYARVSTEEQNLSMQIDALEKFGCDKIFQEKMSTSKQRPQFNKLIKSLSAGDILVVWSIDRLGRDGDENGIVLKNLVKRGVNVMSLTENLQITPLSTPCDMFVYRVLSAHAELEKAQISQRTKEGLASAKEQGRLGGRPPGLTYEAKKKALKAFKMSSSGKGISEISRVLGISRNTVYKYIRFIKEEDFHE